MTKPDDIPQDVWDAAEKALPRYARRYTDMVDVARAILAERERAASIADKYGETVPKSGPLSQVLASAMSITGVEIAKAIRGGNP